MKKLKWLLQDVLINNEELIKKANSLNKLNYNFFPVGLLKEKNFITNIDNLELYNDDKLIFLCGIKLLKIIKEAKNIKDINPYLINKNIFKNIKDGIFYDYEKFDQLYYQKLDIPLLNKNTLVFDMKNAENLFFDVDKFIKPSRDLKSFSGGILFKNTKIIDHIKSGKYIKDYINEKIIIADIKPIIEEYRFFVIDGVVITGSMYVKNNKIFISSNIKKDILNIANEYAKLYKPSSIYVMDLAKLKNGDVKIIEYNCFNCSGSYDSDLILLYGAIQDYLK